MRCSLKVLAPVVMLAAAIPAGVLAQSQGRLFPDVGKPLAQTEIQNFHVAIATDHDVFGLDIAVNNARFMGRGESIGNLAGDV